MTDREFIFEKLKALGIACRVVTHAPAHTMADCAEVDKMLGSLTVKNIFLTTKNGKNDYLCITRPEARFHTADISKQAGSSRLSFAPEETLQARLHCRSGSASPLGLWFESAREVRLIADSALKTAETLSFHPCDNRATVAIRGADFFGKVLPDMGKEPIWVEIHDFIEA